MPCLTIGMATYKDFDGVYFTVQALRMYQDMDGVELLVVDNYGCEATQKFCQQIGIRYVTHTGQGTSSPRNRVFQEATGKAVICLDCHVLLEAGAIRKLKDYYRTNPNTKDLLQGPLLYDPLSSMSTHFDPVWNDHMYGVWSNGIPTSNREVPVSASGTEIPMQGLGLFSCRKEVWPSFNPRFRGFGGEEGYIHEKFRLRGGKCLCLPWLRWVHRFGRPNGVAYPLKLEDRIFNYLVGHAELGLPLEPILDHFRRYVSEAKLKQIMVEAGLPWPVLLVA